MGCGLSRGPPPSPTSRKAPSLDHNSSKSSSSSYSKENVQRYGGKAPERGVSGRGVPLDGASASPAHGPMVDGRRLVLILWDIENVRLPLNTAPGLSPKHIVRYLKRAFIYTSGCTEYRTVCALTERSLARLRRHHPTFIEQVVPDMTVLLASATHAKRNADVSLKKELHQFTHEHAHTARCCPGQLAVVLLSGDEDFLEPLQAALQGGFDVQLVTHDTASGALLAQGYRRPPQLWSSFLRTWSGVQDVVLPYGDEQMHGALRGRGVLVAGLGGGGGRRGGVGVEAVRGAVLQLLRAWPAHEAATQAGEGGQGDGVDVKELADAAEVLLVEPQFGAYCGGYCVVVSLPLGGPTGWVGGAQGTGRQEAAQQGTGVGREAGGVDRGVERLAAYLRRCAAGGQQPGTAAGAAVGAAAPAGGAGGGAAAGAVGSSLGGGGHGRQGKSPPPPKQQPQLSGFELVRGAAVYEGRRLLQVTLQVSETGLPYTANALAAAAAPSGASDGGGSATPKSSDTRAADQGPGRSRSTSRSSMLAAAELADASTVGEGDAMEDGVGIGAACGLRGIHDRMHDATEQLVAVLRAYRPTRLLGPTAGLAAGPGGGGGEAGAAVGGGGGAGASRPQQLQVLCQFSRTPEPEELCRTLLVGSADPWVDLVAAVGHMRGATVQLAVQHGVELRADLLPHAVCQSGAQVQGQGQQETGRVGQLCTGGGGGGGGGGKGASNDMLLQHIRGGAGRIPKGLPALERPAGGGAQGEGAGPGLGGAGQQGGNGSGGGALEGDGQGLLGGVEEGSGKKGKKKRKKKKNKKGKKGAKRNSVVPLPSGD